jgi:hypothetical protein
MKDELAKMRADSQKLANEQYAIKLENENYQA